MLTVHALYNFHSAQRLLLVYADSSDEEEHEEESLMDEAVDEGFSMQTQPGHRQDSLKKIVFLKDSKPGSYSFKEKLHKGKRLNLPSQGGSSRCKQI